MKKNDKLMALWLSDGRWECRENLRRHLDSAVCDALENGWAAEDIASSLEDLIEEHIEKLIDRIGFDSIATIRH